MPAIAGNCCDNPLPHISSQSSQGGNVEIKQLRWIANLIQPRMRHLDSPPDGEIRHCPEKVRLGPGES